MLRNRTSTRARYQIVEWRTGPFSYSIMDNETHEIVDDYRTYSAALHYWQQLEHEGAHVNYHNVIGTRVEVLAA